MVLSSDKLFHECFMMKSLFFAFSILILALAVSAQQPNPTPKAPTGKKPSASKPKATAPVADEKEEFEKARALTDLTEKIQAFEKFLLDFPNSTEKNRALEIISSSKAAIADQRLAAGDNEAGIQLFREAVDQSPSPMSENFFVRVILQFPTNLFSRGQQAAAIEIAQRIEPKVYGSPKFMLGLATFYLGIERPEEAKKLAGAAIALDASIAQAYQTLGLANRLNFSIDEAEKAYLKALELDPESVVSKRSLAEMKRAAGKSDEAVALYRELTAKDPADILSENGLILALFESGNTDEAESALAKSLETTPNNLFLLVGAAYWFAANNNGERAIQFAEQAVKLEPRYAWGRIALARGLMLQNKPFEAEKVLLLARQTGSFPTLDYELATVRLKAGLYEEAARELKRRFAVKDGYVQTYIAGRALREAETFTELLSLERRASIFMPASAELKEEAEMLKQLLSFRQAVETAESSEEDLVKSVDAFVAGDDKMKTHRQLYAANALLESRRQMPKVFELATAAIKGVDSSLEVSNVSAAVMADQLVESRSLAIARDEVIRIPDVPRQTLSTILRGRIEELAGSSLFEQGKVNEAIVRLKRAVSILPEKSAWWRSSHWKLGMAYRSLDNDKDALDSMVKSYSSGPQDRIRRSIVEGVYIKVNGNLEGIERAIGPNPFEAIAAATTPTPEASPSPTPTESETKPVEDTSPTPTPTPVEGETKPVIEASPSPSPTPAESETKPVSESSPTPTPTPAADETKPVTETTPTPTPAPTPVTESNFVPKPLFDPIVITVPKTDVSKTSEKQPTEESVATAAKNDADPLSRPRLAAASENEVPKQSCLVVSQETVSILSNGGNLGILVGANQDVDTEKITAKSNSPDDVLVGIEPEIGKQSRRVFFVIKSISEKKGVFSVLFSSPCGDKEIQVKVR
jgi:tetratricopeptide (TPR) repeat protein